MNREVGVQETVLVVEDDKSLRLGLEKTLRSQGYRVRVAGTGSEGLEAALSERPRFLHTIRGAGYRFERPVKKP